MSNQVIENRINAIYLALLLNYYAVLIIIIFINFVHICGISWIGYGEI